ncbi:DUF2894 domain-containing protein [Actimicrobium antarcticum]|uniref:DUF2894 domain-containing protein n=1 Tax=Actimicrobium antarcticum TaxID=1051899 RepID=A0ABP7SSQ1_9BURK
MNEAQHSDSTDAPADFGALIASLHAAGVNRFDPVRLHYAEVLAARAMAHQGTVKHLLDARLAQALAELTQRFEQAQSDARTTMDRTVLHTPQAADQLLRYFAAHDFRGVQRCAESLNKRGQPASLGALVRLLGQAAPDSAEVHADDKTGARTELKTLRKFRNTWSTLSANKQVTQALEQAPKNAGPINSHMLVLRSLALMRTISPEYLHRFLSYADTLLCLDPGEKEKPATLKKSPAVKATKK